MDRHALYLSTALTVATWTWDAYAQAHGIPYVVNDWLKGIILAPFGKWVLDKTISGGKKASSKVISAGKKLLGKDKLP